MSRTPAEQEEVTQIVVDVPPPSATINSTPDVANSFEYDERLQLTNIRQEAQSSGNAVAPKHAHYDYTDAGQTDLIQRYASTGEADLVAQSQYAYDGQNRLTGLTHYQTNPSTPLAFYTWTFDAGGRLVGQDSVDDAVTYGYDARGQLESADYDLSSIPDETYTYDENGNRTAANGSTYATADQNRMTSDGTYTYEYDSEGNRTLRYIDDNGTKTDITQHQWDGRNRLVGIVRRDSEEGPATFSETLTYDLFNRWIGRSVDADGDGEGAAVDTQFVYDGSQMVLEFQGAFGEWVRKMT